MWFMLGVVGTVLIYRPLTEAEGLLVHFRVVFLALLTYFRLLGFFLPVSFDMNSILASALKDL